MPRLTRLQMTYRCLSDVEMDLTDPDTGEPAPFVALVGANGAGKTTVLDAIARAVYSALEKSWTRVSSPKVPVSLFGVDWSVRWRLDGRAEVSGRARSEQHALLSSVLYVPTGYAPEVFPRELSAGQAPTLPVHQALLPQASHRDRLEHMNGRMHRVHQWWMHQHWEYPETATLGRLWRALAPFLGDRVYAGIEPATHLPKFEVDGATIQFNDLSSGERRIIFLFMEIFMHCGEDGLVLFDEPEAHFHPKWQAMLPAAFAELLPRGQVIVATHSPFIVDGLPAHQLFVLGDTPWWADRMSPPAVRRGDQIFGPRSRASAAKLFPLPSSYTPGLSLVAEADDPRFDELYAQLDELLGKADALDPDSDTARQIRDVEAELSALDRAAVREIERESARRMARVDEGLKAIEQFEQLLSSP